MMFGALVAFNVSGVRGGGWRGQGAPYAVLGVWVAKQQEVLTTTLYNPSLTYPAKAPILRASEKSFSQLLSTHSNQF